MLFVELSEGSGLALVHCVNLFPYNCAAVPPSLWRSAISELSSQTMGIENAVIKRQKSAGEAPAPLLLSAQQKKKNAARQPHSENGNTSGLSETVASDYCYINKRSLFL